MLDKVLIFEYEILTIVIYVHNETLIIVIYVQTLSYTDQKSNEFLKEHDNMMS